MRTINSLPYTSCMVKIQPKSDPARNTWETYISCSEEMGGRVKIMPREKQKILWYMNLYTWDNCGCHNWQSWASSGSNSLRRARGSLETVGSPRVKLRVPKGYKWSPRAVSCHGLGSAHSWSKIYKQVCTIQVHVIQVHATEWLANSFCSRATRLVLLFQNAYSFPRTMLFSVW